MYLDVTEWYLSFGEQLWAAGLLLSQKPSGDVTCQNTRQQTETAHQTLWRGGLRLWRQVQIKYKFLPQWQLHRHINMQVLTSSHIRRVAVEQVVGHTKQGLLQLVFKAGDGGELHVSRSRLHRLFSPLHGWGQRVKAELQVQPLHLFQVVFGVGWVLLLNKGTLKKKLNTELFFIPGHRFLWHGLRRK